MKQQQSLVFLVAMDTLLSWQQKQVLITLLFEGIQTSYLVQMFLEALVISGIFVAMGIMLPWQQTHVLVTILFEGIGTLSLVHIHFEARAIPFIICCYGHFIIAV